MVPASDLGRRMNGTLHHGARGPRVASHASCLFGSVLTDDFRPDSDVDVLVDFEPGQVIGFRIFDIEDELSQILGGHRIDLVREKYLNRRLRNRVLAGAETQYEER